MDMNTIIKQQIQESIEAKQRMLGDVSDISVVAEAMIEAYRNKRKVVWFGNGGSAADAQHLATELVSKFYLDRPALPSMAFNTNSSSLTAIANDYSFDRVFYRQVEAFVQEGDVVIGISTSGNSPNVIEGLKLAKGHGAVTVGLVGGGGGKMRETKGLLDHIIDVPSKDTPRIQEAHITIGHILCYLVEDAFFGKK
jgi:D-sedoheptulose 7-phosphate isomerase